MALVCDPWYGFYPSDNLHAKQSDSKDILPSDCCQTLTLPKPLVEFANKPMILHQVESLAAAGVTDIVLAVNYRPDIMSTALKKVNIMTGISGVIYC
jgi:CMP-2-keto-3-deoxyoctulosonic acid synthetase